MRTRVYGLEHGGIAGRGDPSDFAAKRGRDNLRLRCMPDAIPSTRLRRTRSTNCRPWRRVDGVDAAAAAGDGSDAREREKRFRRRAEHEIADSTPQSLREGAIEPSGPSP